MNISMLINRFITKNITYLPIKTLNQRYVQQYSLSTKVSIPLQKNDRETFDELFPVINDTIVNKSIFTVESEISNWIKKVINYNLLGGKKTRGLATVFAYEMVEKSDNITNESLRQARLMGWCVEMLQYYLLLVDDVIDSSTTRRGKPCWYRNPGVGLGAINDSIMLYAALNHVLRLHFGHLPQYNRIMKLFNDTLMYTTMGQHLDLTMSRRDSKDYSMFTEDRYNAIVKYKTAYYTFNLPVGLGLLLANNLNEAAHSKADDICLDIGNLFQMQDDYIDCFTDESLSGKAGTDIQEGKCSWLAVQALKRCNKAQAVVFKSCYNSNEPAHIERIKQLYNELELPQLYMSKEKALYDNVVNKTKNLPKDLPPTLFLKLLDMIYKRKH